MKKTFVIDKSRFNLWPQGIYENSKYEGYHWAQYEFVNDTQSTSWISILIYRVPK